MLWVEGLNVSHHLFPCSNTSSYAASPSESRRRRVPLRTHTSLWSLLPWVSSLSATKVWSLGSMARKRPVLLGESMPRGSPAPSSSSMTSAGRAWSCKSWRRSSECRDKFRQSCKGSGGGRELLRWVIAASWLLGCVWQRVSNHSLSLWTVWGLMWHVYDSKILKTRVNLVTSAILMSMTMKYWAYLVVTSATLMSPYCTWCLPSILRVLISVSSRQTEWVVCVLEDWGNKCSIIKGA